MQHIVYISCRVSRSNHYGLRLDLVASCDYALDTTIAYDQLLDPLLEVHLATSRANRITHIGDDTWQFVRADMRVRLIQNLGRSTVVNKALQRTVVVASLLAASEELSVRECSCSTLAKGVVRVGIDSLVALNFCDILASLDNLLTSFKEYRS